MARPYYCTYCIFKRISVTILNEFYRIKIPEWNAENSALTNTVNHHVSMPYITLATDNTICIISLQETQNLSLHFWPFQLLNLWRSLQSTITLIICYQLLNLQQCDFHPWCTSQHDKCCWTSRSQFWHGSVWGIFLILHFFFYVLLLLSTLWTLS